MSRQFNYGFFDRKEDRWEYTEDDYFKFNGKEIHASEITYYDTVIGHFKWDESYLKLVCKDGNTYKLPFKVKDLEKVSKVRLLLGMAKITLGQSYMGEHATDVLSSPIPKEKDASVVGRAIAGQIIAGPTGAVVGALSAIDKNNKNRDK